VNAPRFITNAPDLTFEPNALILLTLSKLKKQVGYPIDEKYASHCKVDAT
jgi:hypothetical protein